MSFDHWKAQAEQKAKREHERRKLEDHFNAEIVRLHLAGHAKDEIVARLNISRELFNRVMLAARQGRGDQSP